MFTVQPTTLRQGLIRRLRGVTRFPTQFSIQGLALLAVAVALIATTPTTSAHAKASMGGSSCLPSSLTSTIRKIEEKFGPVRIISTFRRGAKIAGSGRPSLHASCRAIDFKPTRNHAQVVAWLKANHGGGVGTYSGSMNHIHIDSGAYVRFHKGGGTRYASNSSRNRRS